MHYFKLIFAVGVIILNTCGTFQAHENSAQPSNGFSTKNSYLE